MLVRRIGLLRRLGSTGVAPTVEEAARPVRKSAARHGIRYRREIDGLRFWAVVPVILYHAGFGLFRGGFVGVDVFFVISGYLITSIIAREVGEGRFSLISFYERRARRILPALYLVVLVTIVGGWVWYRPSDYADLMASVAAVVGFVSNVLFYRTISYFSQDAEVIPLLHTWSLGVEEQFYVAFPLLFIAAAWLGRRWVVAALALVFLASLLLAQHQAGHISLFSYYLLPTRAWELMLGAFAALQLIDRGHSASLSLNQAGSAIGFALLLAGIVVLDSKTPYPSLWTLIPTLGALFVILFAVKGTLVQRFLGWAPFVWVGLISYSAYLWHQPLFAFARYYRVPAPGPAEMLVLSLAVLPLSYLTWRFVETPFRDAARFSRGEIFTFSAAAGALLLAAGLWGYDTGGLPGRSSMRALAPLAFDPDNRGLEQESWAQLRRLTGDPNYGVLGNPADRRLWFHQPGKLKVLLVGNSHSKDLYNTLEASRRFTDVAEAARYGTQVAQLGARFFDLPNYKAADVIVVCSMYRTGELDHFDWFADRVRHDGKRLVIVRKIFGFPYVGGGQLQDALEAKLHHPGVEDSGAVDDAIDRAYWRDFATGPDRKDRAEADRAIAALVQRHPEVAVLDRMDYVCDRAQQRCFVIGGQLQKYLGDYGHYTAAGARFFGQRLDHLHWLDPIIGSRPASNPPVLKTP